MLAVRDAGRPRGTRGETLLRYAVERSFIEHLRGGCSHEECDRYVFEERSQGDHDGRYFHHLARAPRGATLRNDWRGLAAIGMAGRVTKRGDRFNRGETRYYATSRMITAAAFAFAVRRHWGIGGALDWRVDVAPLDNKPCDSV